MKQLPLYLPIVFILVVLITAFLFARAARFRKPVLLGMGAWLLLQAIISVSGFYSNFSGLPPRLLFLLAPPLLLTLVLLCTARGRQLLDRLDGRTLTLLHSIRIPVEFVLWGLALNRVVPGLITFEGINFDIVSGLTAPLAYYLVYVKRALGRTALLVWNLLCLALLLNVVAHAILSVPTPFQQLSFEQPAIAVGYFPYTLLPGFVVPVVLIAHLTMIRRLLRRKGEAVQHAALA